MKTPQNPVGWFEIYVDDMDRAKNFYQNTFQVTLEKLEMPEVEMWSFPMDSGDECSGAVRTGCPGSLVKMEGMNPGSGGTIVYFTCEDCAVEAARVEENNGKIIQGKFSIGPYGFISLVNDSEGNMIGLHSMK